MSRALVDRSYKPAAIEALKSFPLDDPHIEFVEISENVTFKVIVQGGAREYVLRLHRPGYNTIEELESERMWTRALKEEGVHVQSSLQRKDDQGHYVLVDIPGADEKRYAGITTWLDGRPLYDVLDSQADRSEVHRLYHRIGDILAAMHTQSTQWVVPSEFVRRRLDGNAILGEQPFWGRFWEHVELTKAEQTLLSHARGPLLSFLDSFAERPDNFSLIHADLNPDNIIYNGDRLALIDFDDAAFGWHMYDIAAALIENVFDPDFEAIQTALLEGYQRRRSLPQESIDALPKFLLMRGMALIGWYHQRPEHAGTTYFKNIKNWVIAECAAKRML